MIKQTCLLLIIGLLLNSCSFFAKNDTENAVARVGDKYLYLDDIENLVPSGTSKADSILMVNTYINNWASGILLMDKAKLNLKEDKQENFKNLVAQYEVDLFTKAYLDAVAERMVDTLITYDQQLAVYTKNKESFKLNDELLKLRYVSLPQNAIDLEEIKTRFKRFNNKDKKYLDSISVQFQSYSLNDSLWVKSSQVQEKISVITDENKNQLLKKTNFIQLKDSLNLYLIQIKDVLLRNDYAPIEYVKPTLKKIIFNKRKLELIQQIENDITKDAIRENQFQIYR